MRQRDQLIRQLKSQVELECKLQEQYLKALEAEQAALAAFDTESVKNLTAKRENLLTQIATEQTRRLELIKSFDEIVQSTLSDIKLTDFINSHLNPVEQRELLPIASKLKELVLKSRKLGNEFRSVVEFSLGIVGSRISILWSANQTINNTYSPQGRIKKVALPASRRSKNILKTA